MIRKKLDSINIQLISLSIRIREIAQNGNSINLFYYLHFSPRSASSQISDKNCVCARARLTKWDFIAAAGKVHGERAALASSLDDKFFEFSEMLNYRIRRARNATR